MRELYKIRPIFEERIWGGGLIKKYFNYDTDIENIAQVYHVIGIPGHLDNIVENTGEPLSEFYKTHPEVFNCRRDELPVRLCTGCANGRLSVHLHPDDEYALQHEGMRGKMEGCTTIYADDMDADFEMILGHKAKTREEFMTLLEQRRWEELLRTIKFKPTDFVYYPYNCLHSEKGDGSAISVAFTTNGDVSYRLYDYDRNDESRPLSVEKVLDNIIIPDVESGPVTYEVIQNEGYDLYNYIEIPKEFVAKKITSRSGGIYEYSAFQFILCGSGSGKIEGEEIRAGETLLIPANFGPYSFEGQMDLYMISYIE